MEQPKKKDEGFKKSNVDSFVDAADTMEGFEDINASTMAIPFLIILQKGSPQLDKEDPKFIKGAEVGEWFNTVTKETYGQSINVIALKFEHMYTEWKPDRGGFISYHTVDNANRIAADTTKFGKWKTAEGNDLSENYSYILIIEGHESVGILVYTCASSAIKIAKEWNRLMTSHEMDNGEKAKPYYLVWNLTTEYQTNDLGNWYGPKVQFLKYINPDQGKLARQERVLLPSRNIDYTQLENKSEKSQDETDPDF